jgi:fumarate reductase (CoM/CoB) subunit A
VESGNEGNFEGGCVIFTRHSYDIVIVGGGGAAALAAVAARKAGATVALITKESSLVGGATIMAAGGTSATLSPGDNAEVFFSDIMKAGGQLNNPRLARMVAEKSVEALLDLENYDFLLDRTDAASLRTIKLGEGHAFPRGYLDRREALGFCHALGKALVRNEVAVFPEMTVSKLLVKDNQAIGALGLSLVTGEYVVFNAKSVILATGGLGALYKVTTNSTLLTGDGYAMAWDAGAELVDMEMVQFLPLNFPYPETRRGKIIGMCSHFGSGVKLYNGLGERYMEKYDPERMEFTTRDIASRANFTEIREGRGTKNQAIIVDPREHDPAILFRFKTSIPHIYAMFREVFGERAAEWQEPFEAIPSQHFFMGGVRIDEHCKTTVPGLFAVGEVAGGVHGANRLSGVALTEVFVFGPLVGQAAALFAKSETLLSPDSADIAGEIDRVEGLSKTGNGARPFELKEAVRNLMWDNLGPVRDEMGIRRAIETLEDMQKTHLGDMVVGSDDRKYNRERMEAIEVPLMIRTALFVAYSALARQESRGSHYRRDFPLPDDQGWLKNSIVRKDSNGNAAMHYKASV